MEMRNDERRFESFYEWYLFGTRLVWVMVDCSRMWVSELYGYLPLFVRTWEGGTYVIKLVRRFSLFSRQYCLLTSTVRIYSFSMSLKIIYYSSTALYLVTLKVCYISRGIRNGLSGIRVHLKEKLLYTKIYQF